MKTKSRRGRRGLHSAMHVVVRSVRVVLERVIAVYDMWISESFSLQSYTRKQIICKADNDDERKVQGR